MRRIRVLLGSLLLAVCAHIFIMLTLTSMQNKLQVTIPVSTVRMTPERRDMDDRYPWNPGDQLKQHLTACPIRRPDEASYYSGGYWQQVSSNHSTVYVISAFYDDRPIMDASLAVRILVVDALAKGGPVPYCQLWYDGIAQPVVTAAEITSSGRGDAFNRTKYFQSLYTCPVHVTLPAPTHVSISLDPCQNSTIYEKIVVSGRAPWQHEFGICVAIAFGSIPVEEFVEWVEFHRILGVAEINIYDGGMKNMDGVFRYYHNMGVLRVHSMPPPVKDLSVKGVKLSSPASLNDCMMRNMYRYRYIVVVDFDEFIVPETHDNYSEMVKYIDKLEKDKSPAPSYTFRNRYYFRGSEQDEKEKLFTMRVRRHSNTSGYLFAPKSFIDPRRCISVFNHYCWKRFKRESRFTVDVKPSIATSHHYRGVCNKGKAKCESYLNASNIDTSIMRFKDPLNALVGQALRHIRNGETSTINQRRSL